LGPSFGVDGNLIVSDSTFMKINPNSRPSEMIDVGVITLKPGANAENILESLHFVKKHQKLYLLKTIVISHKQKNDS
jgi:hypothetical protein